MLYTLKTSAEEFVKAFTEMVPEDAKAKASGQTPAKCIKSWNPIPHERTDYMFCLWEYYQTDIAHPAEYLERVIRYITKKGRHD